MKKVLLYVLSLAMAVCVAVAGTVAYLTDTDEDVNVMALGNVSIDQIENEWNTDGTLGDFKDGKPLYPYVGDLSTDTVNGNVNGTDYTKYTIENIVDKIVTVENTGKSDAYVRTWFAFEQGDLTDARFDEIIKMNINETNWSFEDYATGVEIKDEKTNTTSKYVVVCATYDGILGPNQVTPPSLLQVYMDSSATNEDVEAVDGNKNGTYEILVFSQAIQTKGFEVPTTYSNTSSVLAAAKAALNAGFENVHPWDNGVNIPEVVESAKDFEEAIANGQDVVLNSDIVIDGTFNIEEDVNIDLNGHKLTVSVLEAKENTTIKNGTLKAGDSTYPQISVSKGQLEMENVNVECESYCGITTNANSGNQSSEYCGIVVWGGEAILNDCDIVVKCDTKRWSNTVVGVGVHGGEFTMNGGSITVESAGSTTIHNYELAIFAGGSTEKNINLNDVDINVSDKGYYLLTSQGHAVVNTTDAEGSWDNLVRDNINGKNYGTYTINYIK